jgi:MoaA/NifB/PqqE/SkfB family radical SAM enzyme
MEIAHDKLNEKQRFTLKAALSSYSEKKIISSASPPILYIELTKNCIARCEFCRGSSWKNKPDYTMDGKTFSKLLKEYVPYATMVDLRGWGESLMLPNFHEYVGKIADYGPAIRITTTLGCGTKKNLQSLIDHNVFVSVSFDAAEKNVYEKIRSGLVFDNVVRNIEFVTQGIIKKHGTLKGRFRLGVVPLQEKNLGQLVKIIEFAKRHKIEDIRISPLGADPSCPYLLCHHRHKTVEALKEAVSVAKKEGISLQLGFSLFDDFYFKEKAFDVCCHPWLYSYLDHEGNVGFCDHILTIGKSNYLGNILVDKKNKIWNGKRIKKIRKIHALRKDTKMISNCARCYKGGRYADHEQDINEMFMKWEVTENDLEIKIDQLNKEPLF